MNKKLIRIAKYLGQNGFYKEAAQIRKMATEQGSEKIEELRSNMVNTIKNFFQNTKLHLTQDDEAWYRDNQVQLDYGQAASIQQGLNEEFNIDPYEESNENSAWKIDYSDPDTIEQPAGDPPVFSLVLRLNDIKFEGDPYGFYTFKVIIETYDPAGLNQSSTVHLYDDFDNEGLLKESGSFEF